MRHLRNLHPEDTLAALDYALRVTALPYQQPQGPTITDLQPSEATLGTGKPLTLTADFSEPATELRLSVAKPPWLPDAQPIDFPTASPPMTATMTTAISFDTSSLPQGRSLILAQAKNAAGIYGPATAQFVTIAPFQANAAPQRRVIRPGDAAQFTVSVTNTSDITTTYVLSSTADQYLTLDPMTPTVVAPYSAATFTATVTAIRDATDTLVSVAVLVCMEQPPQFCLETAVVVIEPYHVIRFPIISQQRIIKTIFPLP